MTLTIRTPPSDNLCDTYHIKTSRRASYDCPVVRLHSIPEHLISANLTHLARQWKSWLYFLLIFVLIEWDMIPLAVHLAGHINAKTPQPGSIKISKGPNPYSCMLVWRAVF